MSLYSSESAPYDPEPWKYISSSPRGGVIAILVQDYKAETRKMSMCCISVLISKLLKGAYSGQECFLWEDWKRGTGEMAMKDYDLNHLPPPHAGKVRSLQDQDVELELGGDPTKVEATFMDNRHILHMVCEI